MRHATLLTSWMIVLLLAVSQTVLFADPGPRFDGLNPSEQQKIRHMCQAPPPSERRGPYSTPMYYLMHKGYAYEGDWDLNPDSRCYPRMKGLRGKDWGNWKLDRNHADWQEAMVRDWADLGLNATHFNIYPVGGQLTIDPDWSRAVQDFLSLSEQYGIRVGVRLDAIDETKLWSVHPNNPQSQREAYLKWVEQIAALLKGRTIYYVLGDELTLHQPDAKLAREFWTPSMYLEYFTQVSGTIKRIDPHAKVCMFSASSGEWFNVRWLLENGYARVGDGVAINHYDYRSVSNFLADRDRLAPGKMFLTSGVGYVSNGAVRDRYPEGDGYPPAADEQAHAAQVAKTMFMWWDLGADAAPYYISLRNWIVDGRAYPRWFGFFGFEDYIIENNRLSIKRYPAWNAFQTVANTFYNRDELRTPRFNVTTSPKITQMRAFERARPDGQELLLMLWNEPGQVHSQVSLASTDYRYPVRISLRDFHEWESLDNEISGGTTTLKFPIGPEPQIVRLVKCH